MSHESQSDQFPATTPAIDEVACLAYYATNDMWPDTLINDVRDHQAQSDTPNSTALVCGPGGLPYALGLLGPNIRNLIQIDLYSSVPEFTNRKFACLDRSRNWDDYLHAILDEADELQLGTSIADALIDEYESFEESTLCDETLFLAIQERARQLRRASIVGNILNLSDQITLQLQEFGTTTEPSPLSIAFMTNVAGYVDDGNLRISNILEGLPRTKDFIVIDSMSSGGSDFIAHSNTLEQYRMRSLERLFPIANLQAPPPDATA